MKASFYSVVLFCCFLACAKTPDESVLAQVDNEKIRVKDFMQAFTEQSENYGTDILKNPEGSLMIKKKILNGLIEERILLQEAFKKNLMLNSEEEKSILKKLQSGYSQGELERTLQDKKLSLDSWKAKQNKKTIIRKLIDQEIASLIPVNDQSVITYYKSHKNLFREPDQIRCRHIVTNKKDKAETIRSLLENGENFAIVAQKYSESPDRENGGDLGYIRRGQYPKIFEQACFSLATGQTSDVLSSEYGFHLFKVVDKKPGHQLVLNEVKDQIKNMLQREKAEPLLKNWLEELYRSKKIKIDEVTLKKVLLKP